MRLALLVLLAGRCGARRGYPRRAPSAPAPGAGAGTESDADTAPALTGGEGQPPENWSPMVSAARTIYQRTPLLSAVRAMKPQASVVASAVAVCATNLRRHLTVPSAACVALAVLPGEPQRFAIRALAVSVLGRACWLTAHEARLQALAAPLGDAQDQYALVTGCGGALGVSVARALAQRGFGVVVVGSSEFEAKPLARRLRLEFGTRCIAIDAPDLETDAAAAVDALRSRLARASVDVDVVVHTAPLYITQPHLIIVPDAPAVDALPVGGAVLAVESDDGGLVLDAAAREARAVAVHALQARCAAATHLASAFGAGMRERGKGRCVFVVDGTSRVREQRDKGLRCKGPLLSFSKAFDGGRAQARRRARRSTLRRGRPSPPPTRTRWPSRRRCAATSRTTASASPSRGGAGSPCRATASRAGRRRLSQRPRATRASAS